MPTKIEQMVGRKRIDAGMYWGRPLQLIDGCNEIKEGCSNCWERSRTERFMGDCGLVKNGRWTGKIIINKDKLNLLRRKKPTMWSVWNDLFHKKVAFEFVDDVFMAALNHPQHILLVLTKRIDRAAEFWKIATKYHRIPPNVWPGTSISTQKDADEMIPKLLQMQAAVRFVSCEPLLGEIDIRTTQCSIGGLNCEETSCIGCSATYKNNFIGLDWVIVGGESGPKARPMHPDWARSIRDQCQAAGVPFFFKQWGEWLSGADKYALGINTYQGYYPKRVTRIENITFFRVGKKKAGHLLDGKEYREYPK